MCRHLRGVTKLCPPLDERILAQSLHLSPTFQGGCGRERPPGVPPTWLDRIGVPGGPALPHISRKNYEMTTGVRSYHSRLSAVTKFGHTQKRNAKERARRRRFRPRRTGDDRYWTQIKRVESIQHGKGYSTAVHSTLSTNTLHVGGMRSGSSPGRMSKSSPALGVKASPKSYQA